MNTEILVLRRDGSQELAARELPDDFFDVPERENVPTLEERLLALESRAASAETKMSAIEGRFGTMETKVSGMEKLSALRG